MKLFIAVGVLVALLGITEAAVSASEAVDACIQRHPTVTGEDVNTYFSGIYSGGEAITTGNKVASYTTCLLIDSGVLALTGDFNVDVFVNKWFANQSSEGTDKVTADAEECSPIYDEIKNQKFDEYFGDIVNKFNFLSGLTPSFHKCLIEADPEIMEKLSTPLYS